MNNVEQITNLFLERGPCLICSNCNWPVVFCLMSENNPIGSVITYCTNKGCAEHSVYSISQERQDSWKVVETRPQGTVLTDCDEICEDCGSPVIDACCNDEFQNHKDAKEWDWWKYCSNPSCKHHDGEGYHQDTPSWVIYRNESI